MSEVVDLLRRLVAIPSVSGAEEACRDVLADWLARRGLAVTVHGRNVLAVLEGSAPSAGDDRGLLLCSHIDVVPVGAGWTRDPWSAELVDGQVRGRGANDAKSSVAAMAVAAASLDASRFAGRLALAFVCDEETGGEGIEVCGDALPEVHAVVVGEPTGLDVCPGQRGLLRARLVAHGRACHASRPHEGVNPLFAAARDLLAIEALLLDEEHDVLGKATLTATVVRAGERANMVPGECTVELDGRSTPDVDNDALLARLAAVVESEIVVKSVRYQPVITDPDEPIVQLAAAASPTGRLRAFGGVSDLFHLRHLPGVVLGPGTSEASHAPDEWVAVSQVEAAVEVYAAIARQYLGATTKPNPKPNPKPKPTTRAGETLP